MIAVASDIRLQARTRLIVEIYEPDTYRDYGSYGHEEGDTLWWYEDGEIRITDGEEYHCHLLGYERDGDYFRGRYSPANERISLLPALMDDCCTVDYDIPREVFRELENTFPDAVEIEIF